MNTRSNNWKTASKWLVLLVLAISISGCGSTVAPPELEEKNFEDSNCEEISPTEIEPVTGSGYIPDQVVFTGFEDEIEAVLLGVNAINSGKVFQDPEWDVNELLPGFSEYYAPGRNNNKFTIRLYKIDSTYDVSDVILQAAVIANENNFFAVPNFNYILGSPDLEGKPASGSGGIGGGPAAYSEGIDGGVDRESFIALNEGFMNQWALQHQNSDGGPYGINLIDPNSASNTGDSYISSDTASVHVGVFDSSPLETGYFVLTDGPIDYFDICVTALLDDYNQSHEQDSAPNIEHGYYAASLVDLVIEAYAPQDNVNIHLVQVLDKNLLGNLITLLDGTSRYLVAYPNKGNILNWSLVFDENFISELGAGSHQDAVKAIRSLIEELRSNRSDFPSQIPAPDPDEVDRIPVFELETYLSYVGSQGHLVVAAAGNDGKGEGNAANHPKPLAPAAMPAVLGVSSSSYSPDLENQAKLSCFSNDVSSNGVSAPSGDGKNGCQISLSTQCNTSQTDCQDAIIGRVSSAYLSGFAYWTGTSFSTPLVSGLAALVWEINDQLTPEQVKNLIISCQTNSVIDVGRTLQAVSGGNTECSS